MAEAEEALSLFDSVVDCADEDRTKAVALERLIQLSRSPHVREVLATHDAVSHFLPPIALDGSSLLPLLRLLRNLCAGNPRNQDAFVHTNGVNFVAGVVDKSLERKPMDWVAILQVCLQLLGNCCGAGSAQKDAVWEAFFPNKFRAVALVENEGKVMEPLCMVIYTCAQENTGRLQALCFQEGAFLLASCLQAVRTHEFSGDWISLLLVELLSASSLVPQMFASLQGPYEEAFGLHQFTSEQATLLGCVLHVLDEELVHNNLVMSKIDFSDVVKFLAQTLRNASDYWFKFSSTTSSVLSHATGPSGIPVIDLLGYTLELIKIISGLDCEDEKLGNTFSRSFVVGKLLQDGVIELCLELLRDLGPPDLIMKAMQHCHADVNERNHQGEDLQMKHCAHGVLKKTLSKLPYRGYRRDLVAIIGNAAYQERAVQDAVRYWGGLYLLLEQCVVDDANPYLREWGLWAIRNLVCGNMENSKELAQLQLRGTVTPIELADMGYKVEIDSDMGRPKLVNMPSEKE